MSTQGQDVRVLECVVNVSEGVDLSKVRRLAEAAEGSLLDVHVDADHHRSVLTLAGANVETDARALTRQTVKELDLAQHVGVHPRSGVVDVVPFVPLDGSTFDDALAARDAFAAWAVDELDVPTVVYGPERSLPDLRRAGHANAHPTAGVICVGARPPLVAYNLWLRDPNLDHAKKIAKDLRNEHLRTLALQVGPHAQISCNLISPEQYGPAAAYDAVGARADIDHAELVGLVPATVLHAIDEQRWNELDLGEDQTIEARLRGGPQWGKVRLAPS